MVETIGASFEPQDFWSFHVRRLLRRRLRGRRGMLTLRGRTTSTAGPVAVEALRGGLSGLLRETSTGEIVLQSAGSFQQVRPLLAIPHSDPGIHLMTQVADRQTKARVRTIQGTGAFLVHQGLSSDITAVVPVGESVVEQQGRCVARTAVAGVTTGDSEWETSVPDGVPFPLVRDELLRQEEAGHGVPGCALLGTLRLVQAAGLVARVLQ